MYSKNEKYYYFANKRSLAHFCQNSRDFNQIVGIVKKIIKEGERDEHIASVGMSVFMSINSLPSGEIKSRE